MKDGRIEKGKQSNPFKKQGSFGGSLTDIDPQFKAAADKAGYDLRWLNQKELIENQGYHKRLWTPVKRDAFGKVEGSGIANLKFGESADGYIRRGTMILGHRSKELTAQHKDMLRESREAYASVLPQQAEKLRESARSNGIETNISDRYDES